MEAWRWLGEDFIAAWILKTQLMVAQQKIDMLVEKYEDTQDKNDCRSWG